MFKTNIFDIYLNIIYQNIFNILTNIFDILTNILNNKRLKW